MLLGILVVAVSLSSTLLAKAKKEDDLDIIGEYTSFSQTRKMEEKVRQLEERINNIIGKKLTDSDSVIQESLKEKEEKKSAQEDDENISTFSSSIDKKEDSKHEKRKLKEKETSIRHEGEEEMETGNVEEDEGMKKHDVNFEDRHVEGDTELRNWPAEGFEVEKDRRKEGKKEENEEHWKEKENLRNYGNQETLKGEFKNEAKDTSNVIERRDGNFLDNAKRLGMHFLKERSKETASKVRKGKKTFFGDLDVNFGNLPKDSSQDEEVIKNIRRLIASELQGMKIPIKMKEAEERERDSNVSKLGSSVNVKDTFNIDSEKDLRKDNHKNEELRKPENEIFMAKLSKNGGIENHVARKSGEKNLTKNFSTAKEEEGAKLFSNTRTKFVRISILSENSTDVEEEKGTLNFDDRKSEQEKINGTVVAHKLDKTENKNVQRNSTGINVNRDKIDNIESRTEEETSKPGVDDIVEAADFGMQAMNDLYYIKEPKLYSMGLFLSSNDPATYVAAFNDQTDEARHLAKFGFAALEGSRLFFNKYPEFSREVPLTKSTPRSTLHRQCPRRGVPQCTAASIKYRTTDGSCNNREHLWWGSAMSSMQRFLPPVYEDGIQTIRRSVTGKSLPSPRDISNTVHQDKDVPLASVTHMLMQWGQFIDHDITATGQSRGFNGTVPQCCLPHGLGFQPPEFMHPECLPIAVSPQDTFLGPLGVKCLEFVRSGPAPRENCDFGPREQLSQVTSFVDASTVYSSNAHHSDSLRLFRNGLLQYGRIQSRRPVLPREEPSDLCRRGSLSMTCFRAGDGRVSEQPGLTSLHVVFLRQHNRIATQMTALNPHWSDEKLFQEIRKIVAALVQHITYREFLPIVLGHEVMKLFNLEILKKGYYEGYDPTVNPDIANAFSTAAYRFGHSMVQSSFVRFDRNHQPLFNNVSLHNEFANPVNLETAGSVDRLLLGLVNQQSQKRDEFLSGELTNRLFQTPGFPFGMDLASLNIQRGRDHGIPPYVRWREPCSLSAIRTWEDLDRVMSASTARKLRELYSHVEDVDLFPAGLAERAVPGGLVGPTFACIIAQQFSNLRKGDRFWYENPNLESGFTPAQLRRIKRVTLAQVLCKTMDSIETIQPFVFLTADTLRNGRLPCGSEFIGTLDLEPWRERQGGTTNKGDQEEDVEIVESQDVEVRERTSSRNPGDFPTSSGGGGKINTNIYPGESKSSGGILNPWTRRREGHEKHHEESSEEDEGVVQSQDVEVKERTSSRNPGNFTTSSGDGGNINTNVYPGQSKSPGGILNPWTRRREGHEKHHEEDEGVVESQDVEVRERTSSKNPGNFTTSSGGGGKINTNVYPGESKSPGGILNPWARRREEHEKHHEEDEGVVESQDVEVKERTSSKNPGDFPTSSGGRGKINTNVYPGESKSPEGILNPWARRREGHEKHHEEDEGVVESQDVEVRERTSSRDPGNLSRIIGDVKGIGSNAGPGRSKNPGGILGSLTGILKGTTSTTTPSPERKSLLRPTRPVKVNTNVNQRNRITVNRPLGPHENLTIVVQNHAVNSPIFVSEGISGSHFQILQQTTKKPPKLPGSGSTIPGNYADGVQRPIYQGNFGSGGYGEVPSTVKPVNRPRPTKVRPYVPQIIQELPGNGSLIPGNYADGVQRPIYEGNFGSGGYGEVPSTVKPVNRPRPTKVRPYNGYQPVSGPYGDPDNPNPPSYGVQRPFYQGSVGSGGYVEVPSTVKPINRPRPTKVRPYNSQQSVSRPYVPQILQELPGNGSLIPGNYADGVQRPIYQGNIGSGGYGEVPSTVKPVNRPRPTKVRPYVPQIIQELPGNGGLIPGNYSNGIQRPFYQGNVGSEGYVEVPSTVKPVNRPRPTKVRPYNSQQPVSRPYVPHNIGDPDNPNPPSYGYQARPTNDHIPDNDFFNWSYRPSVGYIETPRPISTASSGFNVDQDENVHQGGSQQAGLGSGGSWSSARPGYGSAGPFAEQGPGDSWYDGYYDGFRMGQVQDGFDPDGSAGDREENADLSEEYSDGHHGHDGHDGHDRHDGYDYRRDGHGHSDHHGHNGYDGHDSHGDQHGHNGYDGHDSHGDQHGHNGYDGHDRHDSHHGHNGYDGHDRHDSHHGHNGHDGHDRHDGNHGHYGHIGYDDHNGHAQTYQKLPIQTFVAPNGQKIQTYLTRPVDLQPWSHQSAFLNGYPNVHRQTGYPVQGLQNSGYSNQDVHQPGSDGYLNPNVHHRPGYLVQSPQNCEYPDQNVHHQSGNDGYSNQNVHHQSENNGYPNINVHRPSVNDRYPNQNVHQSEKNGYLNQNVHHLSGNNGYPNQNVHHQSGNNGYPNPNVHHQSENGGYPNENVHHQSGNDGNANENVHHQSENNGYSNQNVHHQSGNNGYANENVHHQSGNNGYANENVHHQSGNNGYSNQNVHHQSGNNGYANQNVHHQSENNGYPNPNVHRQSENNGYTNQNVHHQSADQEARVEVPKPLLVQHRQDDFQLSKTIANESPTQYYYNKNVLKRYPDGIDILTDLKYDTLDDSVDDSMTATKNVSYTRIDVTTTDKIDKVDQRTNDKGQFDDDNDGRDDDEANHETRIPQNYSSMKTNVTGSDRLDNNGGKNEKNGDDDFHDFDDLNDFRRNVTDSPEDKEEKDNKRQEEHDEKSMTTLMTLLSKSDDDFNDFNDFNRTVTTDTKDEGRITERQRESQDEELMTTPMTLLSKSDDSDNDDVDDGDIFSDQLSDRLGSVDNRRDGLDSRDRNTKENDGIMNFNDSKEKTTSGDDFEKETSSRERRREHRDEHLKMKQLMISNDNVDDDDDDLALKTFSSFPKKDRRSSRQAISKLAPFLEISKMASDEFTSAKELPRPLNLRSPGS
ncbi:uncharacterized protein LOC105701425 isoform X2 [Orussus abietinus]|uniref:uncharacterized protein LOC105701425 isoform X2 n=1 Tax=Orussus abietinus TaxID=222816 RepID=UPI000C715EC1|nr:uncharacterized protein LOC105701425 isoform X2 [Orussus abietinus]